MENLTKDEAFALRIAEHVARERGFEIRDIAYALDGVAMVAGARAYLDAPLLEADRESDDSICIAENEMGTSLSSYRDMEMETESYHLGVTMSDGNEPSPMLLAAIDQSLSDPSYQDVLTVCSRGSDARRLETPRHMLTVLIAQNYLRMSIIWARIDRPDGSRRGDGRVAALDWRRYSELRTRSRTSAPTSEPSTEDHRSLMHARRTTT